MRLTAEGISKEYLRENAAAGTNRFCAVRETSLTLEPGTVTVLTGRSGSGKTTLLHMLGGLSEPGSGRVLLGDTDLYALPDKQRSALRNREFGIIPQGQTALHSLTAAENILLPCYLSGEKPDLAFAEELMQRLDISALRDARPAALSGGELRRVAIARALIRRPSVILADEPTGDLDDENTKTVFGLLKETAEAGAAVLIVTHETDAAQYADRQYRMQSGALTEPDAP
ncbi:MAG: ABC transporter ATP-binding protein [Oscillospiraceae bacterium]|nr:ABC transporter ATP-binding protein [Oscillospiraceae bacterium]